LSNRVRCVWTLKREENLVISRNAAQRKQELSPETLSEGDIQEKCDKFPLTSCPSGVGMLLNIYLTSRSHFVGQNHGSISCTFVKFSLAGVSTRTNFPCPKAGMTSFGAKLLGKEILSIFCCTHERIKLVKENLSRKKFPSDTLYPALHIVTSLARAKYRNEITSFKTEIHRKPFFALVSFMVQHTNRLECCRSLRSAVFHLDAVLWLSK
jgi:hypothetical protein